MHQSLHALQQLIPECDWNQLRHVVSVKQPISTCALEILRQKVLQAYPGLKTWTDPNRLDLVHIASTNRLKPRDQFSLDDMRRISKTEELLRNMFPDESHVVEHRVCSKEQFSGKYSRAGTRALFDIVGFQIIPKDVTNIEQVLRALLQVNVWDLLFVFNTTNFLPEDFPAFIGPTSSPFYRAVHLYVAQDGICTEIQIRLPSTHAWSSLHHATIYKPRVNVDEATKEWIEQLGASANYLDYRSMLR